MRQQITGIEPCFAVIGLLVGGLGISLLGQVGSNYRRIPKHHQLRNAAGLLPLQARWSWGLVAILGLGFLTLGCLALVNSIQIAHF